MKFCCAHIIIRALFCQIHFSGCARIDLIQTDSCLLWKLFVTDSCGLQEAEHQHCFVLYGHILYLRFLLFALFLYFGYTFTRGTQKEQKFFLRVPPTFTVGKYLFEVWRVFVPAAVNDNLTHSTLVKSAIFPLPTFTDISLPDGFSYRFVAPKGEMPIAPFRFVFASTFYSIGCTRPLLTLILWRFSCSSFHVILFSFCW